MENLVGNPELNGRWSGIVVLTYQGPHIGLNVLFYPNSMSTPTERVGGVPDGFFVGHTPNAQPLAGAAARPRSNFVGALVYTTEC